MVDDHRDGYGPPQVEIINIGYPWAVCSICGCDTELRWGIPISTETAMVIDNDSDEDWAGKPACYECFKNMN